MIINKNNKIEIECISCKNNYNKVCPCVIFSGNTELPNLFNKNFPIIEKIKLNSRYGKFASKKENIYEGKVL